MQKRVSLDNPAARAALATAVFGKTPDGRDIVSIPQPLDRGLYEQVDGFFKAFQGKWQRPLRGHVFPLGTDMLPIIAAVREKEVAEVVRDDYFPTPPEIARQLIELARLTPPGQPLSGADGFLEPSAGEGAIADAAIALGVPAGRIAVFELNDARQALLAQKGYRVLGADFLAFPPEPRWRRVVMNPPFLRHAWIEHVRHAYACLVPGGRLVAVVPESLAFSSERPVQAFRTDLLHRFSVHDEALPAESFRVSGTGVNTRVIVLARPEPATRPAVAVPAPVAPAVAAPPDRLTDLLSGARWRAVGVLDGAAYAAAKRLPSAKLATRLDQLPAGAERAAAIQARLDRLYEQAEAGDQAALVVLSGFVQRLAGDQEVTREPAAAAHEAAALAKRRPRGRAALDAGDARPAGRRGRKAGPLEQYLGETIDYGGTLRTRGELMAEMAADGTPRNLIDAYMMGAKAVSPGPQPAPAIEVAGPVSVEAVIARLLRERHEQLRLF